MATDPLSLVEPQYMVNLKGKMHPTYPGVLAAAMKAGLTSLEVEVIQFPLPENGNLAVCQATATFRGEDGRDLVFTEIGDCDDVNANRMIVPHKLRMAATRSKGRALRDSLGIGVALVEEMGTDAQETTAGNGAAHSGVREQGGTRRDTPAAGQQSRARGSSAPVVAARSGGSAAAGALGEEHDGSAVAPVEGRGYVYQSPGDRLEQAKDESTILTYCQARGCREILSAKEAEGCRKRPEWFHGKEFCTAHAREYRQQQAALAQANVPTGELVAP